MVGADDIEQVDEMLVAGQGDMEEEDGERNHGSEAGRVSIRIFSRSLRITDSLSE